MQLVTRAEWGAQPPKAPIADLPTALGVKVHWIGGPYTTPDHSQCAAEVRAIQEEHMSNPTEGWLDIAYNFVVCGHSYVFEGRGLRKEDGANGNQPLNKAHYAVCAIQGTNEQLSDGVKNGVRDAIEYLQANGAGGEILGHRDGYSTDCPGDELYAWVHAGAPRPGGGSGSPQPTGGGSPASSGPAFPGRVLRLENPQMHGDDVRQVQQRLLDRGWNVPGGADGWFGPHTADVVRAFQADSTAHGWSLAADAEVGPLTWAALWDRPIS
jgi:hypothetical protein